VDPEKGSDVVKAVGLAKRHADDEEQNTDLVISLVRSKAVVRSLVENGLAAITVDAGVDDPVLWHVPLVFDGHVEQRVDSEHEQTRKERLELAQPAALQDETRLLTPPVNLLVEGQADHQVDESCQRPYHRLVKVVEAVDEPSVIDLDIDGDDQKDQQSIDEGTVFACVLVTRHYELVVQVKEGEEGVHAWACKREDAMVPALDVRIVPERPAIFVDDVEERHYEDADRGEQGTLKGEQTVSHKIPDDHEEARVKRIKQPYRERNEIVAEASLAIFR
jgi:hypothetical protein